LPARSTRGGVSPRLLPKINPLASQLGNAFHRDGWIFEEKYDGWRIVAYKDGASVRLLSRTGRDHAKRFPEVTAAVGPGDELPTPPVLIVFDCLYLRGRDLGSRPLRDRQKALEDTVAGASMPMALRPGRPCGSVALRGWLPKTRTLRTTRGPDGSR
jgi:ATP-dependent DNA ligase